MVSGTRLRVAALAVAVVSSATPSRSFAQRAAPLPTPESVIGFPVGADYKLFTYDQSIDYFKRLAAASNRVKLITVEDVVREDVDRGDHFVAGESRQSRSHSRREHAAGASGGAE